MSDAVIRPARLDDASGLAALGRQTFVDTFVTGFGIPYPADDLAVFLDASFSPEATAMKLKEPGAAWWVAERDGVLLAFANAGPNTLPHPDGRSSHAELRRLYVSKDAQGLGLGAGLLALSLDWMEAHTDGPLWIGVWSGNVKAQKLYEAHGFEKAGEYQYPVGRWLDDEVILRRGSTATAARDLMPGSTGDRAVFLRFVAAASLALASPALAQDAATPAPVASPEQAAEARAIADRIIARGEAAAYFDNVTDADVPTVRHGRSGMTCTFAGETAYDFVRVFPQQAGGPGPGDDVMCNTRSPQMDFSSYATRYADQYSAEAILSDALAAIRQRFPDAKPHEGPLAAAGVEGGPQPLIGAYEVTVEGRPKLTLALVAHQGEWSFKGRATGALEDETLNLLMALTFLSTLPQPQGE